jgi:hypothetical protein
MNEETFETSIRKFLKLVGVSSQRELERAVAHALRDNAIQGTETLAVTMTLEMSALKVHAQFSGELRLQ